LVIIIFLLIVVVSWWQTQSNSRPVVTEGQKPARQKHVDKDRHPTDAPVPAEVEPESATYQRADEAPAESAARIPNQTIRDQSGKVLFRGTIDLQPTLDRIERGERNSHRNDGTTFQNRERRLPVRPGGYYKEFVHPTPGTSGPGPQRVIVGKEGEVWYTPDHYLSFKQIR
jgi:guanyl-specific ribonuclease Sa